MIKAIDNDLQVIEEQERDAVTLFKHIKELAQLKYDSELRREDSLIKQSTQMQTVFSFVTAAIFMALAVIIENRGSLSLVFFLVASASIMFFLLISLVMASFAQRRRIHSTFPDIDELEKFVSDHWESTVKESQQLKQWIDLVGKVQKDKANINNERVTFIRVSMWSFFASIISIVFWFLVAIAKIL